LLTDQLNQTVDSTAPLRRGERRKQHTKRRLLDAAAEVYAEVGVEGATISAITERADVGLGTFYLHFEDKDSIAVAVSGFVLRRLENEETAALETVRSFGGSPDPLATLARVVCARTTDTPGLMCALLRWDGPAIPTDAADADSIALRHALLPRFAERYSEGVSAGLYRMEDPSFAATALLGLIANCIPAFVAQSRTDWNSLASFLERAMVSMFRR
jgi:AcrR family transcriptional regulator